jgi:hypothetical protein
MRPRPSSSPADPPSGAWYGHVWPWLLFGGPAIVVVASIFTAWLAVRSDDGLVAADYYKRGLLVNQRLPANAVVTPIPEAAMTIDNAGGIRLRTTEASPRERLTATLTHPASSRQERVTLLQNASGEYVGVLRAEGIGRWAVSFDRRETEIPAMLVERR